MPAAPRLPRKTGDVGPQAQRHAQAREIPGRRLRHFLEDHAIGQLLRAIGIAAQRHAHDLLTVGGDLQYRRSDQHFARVLQLLAAADLRPADHMDLHHHRRVFGIHEGERLGAVRGGQFRPDG